MMAVHPFYRGDVRVILNEIALRTKIKQHQKEQKEKLKDVERKLESALEKSKSRSTGPSDRGSDH